MDKCKYCGGDIAIRNPTGKCDHLYYPENVDTYQVTITFNTTDSNQAQKNIESIKELMSMGAGIEIESEYKPLPIDV